MQTGHLYVSVPNERLKMTVFKFCEVKMKKMNKKWCSLNQECVSQWSSFVNIKNKIELMLKFKKYILIKNLSTHLKK